MAESKFKDRDELYYVSELERLFKKQLETYLNKNHLLTVLY